MDCYAKTVYRFVLKQPDHEFLTLMYPDQIPGGAAKYHDFVRACDYLVNQGYAVKIPKVNGISLTHEGIHKLEIEIRTAVRRFFTHFIPGVLSGIFISVFGAVLTALIRSRVGI